MAHLGPPGGQIGREDIQQERLFEFLVSFPEVVSFWGFIFVPKGLSLLDVKYFPQKGFPFEFDVRKKRLSLIVVPKRLSLIEFDSRPKSYNYLAPPIDIINILLHQGVSSATEAIHATKVRLTKKKKKPFIRAGNLYSAGWSTQCDKAAPSKTKEKQGEDPTISRNSLPVGVDHRDLNHLREYFSIPTYVERRLPPGADQRLKFPLTDEISISLEKLRGIFKNKVHWTIFCEEGVLIGAGEILLTAKDTVPPKTIPLADMKGKRHIAFKKEKVLKRKADSLQHPCLAKDILPSSSSPIPSKSIPDSFAPSLADSPLDPSPSPLPSK
ncbi:hypothetical protein LIER_31778 [Lithospermum erythrorhizon]|uniref:Uncharacterized protein n=1 Tax=Lithospermum erythrorhizon TaxID=34254 RepID=A0AAV3RVI1_LITER